MGVYFNWLSVPLIVVVVEARLGATVRQAANESLLGKSLADGEDLA